MKVGDLSTDRQPQAGSGWLSCEERIEYLGSHSRIYADPFVEDSNYDGIRTDSTRRVISLDGDSAAIRHRFNGVSEEIHKKLDELTGIALDLRQLVWAAQVDLHLLFLSSWGVDCDNIVKQR